MTNEELFRRLSEGDSSVREEIIITNQPLVGSIACKYGNSNHYAFMLEDMMSIGTIGLIKATDSFDLGKGIKFSTYAARCIENEIRMELRRIRRRPVTVSLDYVVDQENHTTIQDLLPDIEMPVDDRMECRCLVAKGLNAIKKLPERQRIIMAIFIDPDNNLRQSDVAKRLGVSQSYISRAISKSQKKLRQTCGYEA